MEETQITTPAVNPAVEVAATPARQPCSTCGTVSPASGSGNANFIYVLGRIEPRFPRASVEKELAQVTGRSDAAGLTDNQALHTVLSKRENRYLLRQMCWVLNTQGLDTYILMPRDPVELELLVDSLRPTPSPMDIDVVIGTRGPIAPPDFCNGLQIPIVAFDQIYSFDRESLIKSIPKPEKAGAKEFIASANELLDRILQITDNSGSTDDHRALNYLAVRYPAIYGRAAASYAENSSLSAVEVRPSSLSGSRKIVDVIFCFTNRTTDVTDKYSVRVDVTEEFPFLVKKMSPYFDR